MEEMSIQTSQGQECFQRSETVAARNEVSYQFRARTK